MLHQIRKMIGLAVAIMRGFATKDTLENAFKMEKVDIPIAPGLNLLLEQVLYLPFSFGHTFNICSYLAPLRQL
jgi:tRNA pseudouridine38-40 synthase